MGKRIGAALLALMSWACGDDASPSDSGFTDGGIDVGTTDAGTDASRDATTDGPTTDTETNDVGFDTATDAPTDVPLVDVGAPVINEVVANHVGMDTLEYIEIFGDADTDLSSLTLVVLEGDADSSSGSPGVIDTFFAIGTTDGSGYFVLDELPMDSLENGTQTYVLVQSFTGGEGEDLDTDDDGTLDAEPWARVLDAVGTNDGGDGDVTYGVELGIDFDAQDFAVGGMSRLPNGADTDTAGDWVRNDFDGAGLPSLDPGTPQDGEALNTPGAENAAATTPVAILNEFVFNHVGEDTDEFVEVLGPPNTNLASLSIVLIEGDVFDGGEGRIDGVIPVGTTDASGYWASPFSVDIENGTQTMLLVIGFRGVAGLDLDTDDDGSLDTTPWGSILDAVAVSDLDTDLTYATPVLTPDFDSAAQPVGGASRIPDGTDTDAVGDWVRNDFDGDGLPSFTATATSGEAINTPAAANSVAP